MQWRASVRGQAFGTRDLTQPGIAQDAMGAWAREVREAQERSEEVRQGCEWLTRAHADMFVQRVVEAEAGVVDDEDFAEGARHGGDQPAPGVPAGPALLGDGGAARAGQALDSSVATEHLGTTELPEEQQAMLLGTSREGQTLLGISTHSYGVPRPHQGEDDEEWEVAQAQIKQAADRAVHLKRMRLRHAGQRIPRNLMQAPRIGAGDAAQPEALLPEDILEAAEMPPPEPLGSPAPTPGTAVTVRSAWSGQKETLVLGAEKKLQGLSQLQRYRAMSRAREFATVHGQLPSLQALVRDPRVLQSSRDYMGLVQGRIRKKAAKRDAVKRVPSILRELERGDRLHGWFELLSMWTAETLLGTVGPWTLLTFPVAMMYGGGWWWLVGVPLLLCSFCMFLTNTVNVVASALDPSAEVRLLRAGPVLPYQVFRDEGEREKWNAARQRWLEEMPVMSGDEIVVASALNPGTRRCYLCWRWSEAAGFTALGRASATFLGADFPLFQPPTRFTRTVRSCQVTTQALSLLAPLASMAGTLLCVLKSSQSAVTDGLSWLECGLPLNVATVLGFAQMHMSERVYQAATFGTFSSCSALTQVTAATVACLWVVVQQVFFMIALDSVVTFVVALVPLWSFVAVIAASIVLSAMGLFIAQVIVPRCCRREGQHVEPCSCEVLGFSVFLFGGICMVLGFLFAMLVPVIQFALAADAGWDPSGVGFDGLSTWSRVFSIWMFVACAQLASAALGMISLVSSKWAVHGGGETLLMEFPQPGLSHLAVFSAPNSLPGPMCGGRRCRPCSECCLPGADRGQPLSLAAADRAGLQRWAARTRLDLDGASPSQSVTVSA